MEGFAVYTSQYGPVRVDWNDGAVTGLRIVTQADNTADGPGEPTELTDLAFHELERYFAGDLRQFTTPIAFTYGTPFQQAVWRALLQIPYGETRTYAQIAEAVGYDNIYYFSALFKKRTGMTLTEYSKSVRA